MGQKTKYSDNWFDLAFMKVFGSKMENILEKGGKKKNIGSYEDFVDTSRKVMRGRTPAEQRQIVAKVLSSLLPPNAPATDAIPAD